MAINTNREKARLDKTIAAITTKEAEVKKLTAAATNIREHFHAPMATLNTNLAKIVQLDEITKSGEALNLALCALLVTKQQQEDALKRQEADYPQKLKRHLAKCRRHGWQDARLGQPKKKAS